MIQTLRCGFLSLSYSLWLPPQLLIALRGIRNVHSGGCDAGGGVEGERRKEKKKKFIIFFFFSILINQINVNENF
jgi:hypothetical protein